MGRVAGDGIPQEYPEGNNPIHSPIQVDIRDLLGVDPVLSNEQIFFIYINTINPIDRAFCSHAVTYPFHRSTGQVHYTYSSCIIGYDQMFSIGRERNSLRRDEIPFVDASQ